MLYAVKNTEKKEIYMTNLFINPLPNQENDKPIYPPSFFLGKYIVTKIVPPRDKTVRDGMVTHLALLSFLDKDGNWVETTTIAEGPGGYVIDFPHGKTRITATKYRGPKSWYQFYDPETKNKFSLGKRDPKTGLTDVFTIAEAKKHVLSQFEENTLSEEDMNLYIDEYFHNMYYMSFAYDFNIVPKETEIGKIPFPGMVTELYHIYTPPINDEKWGNVIVSKFAKEGSPQRLTGAYESYPAQIAEAILDKLTSSDFSFQHRSSFTEREDNDII